MRDLFLTPSEMRELRRLTHTAVGRVALRALMVLWRAEGFTMLEIAQRLGCHRDTVTAWIERYRAFGVAGLSDEQGSSRRGQGDILWLSELEELSAGTAADHPRPVSEFRVSSTARRECRDRPRAIRRIRMFWASKRGVLRALVSAGEWIVGAPELAGAP